MTVYRTPFAVTALPLSCPSFRAFQVQLLDTYAHGPSELMV